MKNRVFPFISILALLIAMTATTTAFAQSSPGQDVYNPDGEVLDVVQGGGEPTPAPESDTTPAEDNAPAPAKQENGSSPSVCSAADGRDASGNAVSYGSSADCATATAAASAGELPFTGFEAGLVGLAGLALLGAGFAMRRFTRSDVA